jgi:hypothetical protein
VFLLPQNQELQGRWKWRCVNIFFKPCEYVVLDPLLLLVHDVEGLHQTGFRFFQRKLMMKLVINTVFGERSTKTLLRQILP